MTLGQSIAYIRNKKGFTQPDVCVKVGIGQTYLSIIENDKANPSIKLLKEIAELFKIPYQIFFLYAISEDDFSESKKATYRVIYPSIKEMINSLLSEDESVEN